MNNLLISNALKNTLFTFLLAVIITAAIILIAKIILSKRVSYSLKSAYMTKTELFYYRTILQILGNNYLLFPQVNLASIINKDTKGFRNELFRNADFGVFDLNYKPLLLIEINDNSHLKSDRIMRDKSVGKICKSAKIPLITFWTKDNLNEQQIFNVLKKYL